MDNKLGIDLHENDSLLDGISFNDLIVTLQCNEEEINEATVIATAREITDLNMRDFQFLLKNNMGEIIKRVKGASA